MKRKPKSKICAFLGGFLALSLCGCAKNVPEMTLEEIELAREETSNAIIEQTKSKPFTNKAYVAGELGGVWYSSITADPKSFNQLIAERDGSTAAIVSMMTTALFDYNMVTKEWIPEAGFFEIITDEQNQTLDVKVTLRPDLYWSFAYSDIKIPVTSDDVIFWYDEITGNAEFASSAYNAHFMITADGEEAEITIEKIDEKSFVFHFPGIIAEPLLSTNCDLKPSFLYKKALEEDGIQAVKDLLSVNTDVLTIPSCGMWFLTEYTPGQRLVYERNADYWKKDDNKTAIPYYLKNIVQIVSDANTESLLFKQGKKETYSIRPEELENIVGNQKNDYTVYNAEGSLGAGLWSFNQNPKNKDSAFYRWFTKKEFRQALSCLFNRERVIAQTYRGLAEPKYDFFPSANPFYNENITLKYQFNPEMALQLLRSIGFTRKSDGILYDSLGTKVEFDLTIPSGSSTNNDIAQIISDECSKIGIKVNVRQLDFQKIIEQLTATYDWQTVIIGLGANLWPTQGSNVWPSDGNLHLWYPLQEKPATDWEARIDYLYNQGQYTINRQEAENIWNEYQNILLEECPIVYLVRAKSFYAVRNKWDQTNFYFDNMYGAITEHMWLAE